MRCDTSCSASLKVSECPAGATLSSRHDMRLPKLAAPMIISVIFSYGRAGEDSVWLGLRVRERTNGNGDVHDVVDVHNIFVVPDVLEHVFYDAQRFVPY